MNKPVQCLVSVNSVEEACMIYAAGFRLIDIKNTAFGALAMLDLATTQAIMAVLQGIRANSRQPQPYMPNAEVMMPPLLVSATVGDASDDANQLYAHIQARFALGIDFIKLPMQIWQSPRLQAVIAQLLAEASPLIAVFPPTVLTINQTKKQLLVLSNIGFKGVMVDTLDKNTRLTQMVPPVILEQFIQDARQCDLMVGLAGGLAIADFSTLAPLAPHYIGFRSGLCANHQRVRGLDQDLCLSLQHHVFDYYQKPLKPMVLLGAQV